MNDGVTLHSFHLVFFQFTRSLLDIDLFIPSVPSNSGFGVSQNLELVCVPVPRRAAQLRQWVEQLAGRLATPPLSEEELTLSHGPAPPRSQGCRPPPAHQPDEDRRGIRLQTGIWGNRGEKEGDFFFLCYAVLQCGLGQRLFLMVSPSSLKNSCSSAYSIKILWFQLSGSRQPCNHATKAVQ